MAVRLTRTLADEKTAGKSDAATDESATVTGTGTLKIIVDGDASKATAQLAKNDDGAWVFAVHSEVGLSGIHLDGVTLSGSLTDNFLKRDVRKTLGLQVKASPHLTMAMTTEFAKSGTNMNLAVTLHIK